MRVLVTGAAGAIGAATAKELVARGHAVVATARDPRQLEEVAAEQRLALDVTDERSVREAVSSAGDLDAVVNNAGISASGPLENFPVEDLAAVLDTNTLGPLRVLQAVLPGWRARGSGVIINVSSVQGRVSTPLGGPYSASKFALEALCESLHYELGHFGIRVVVIEPGYIAPGMKAGRTHDGPAAYGELREQWEGADGALGSSEGRPGPELVAEAIADALEDPSSPLRVPVGEDAQLVLGARRSLDDGDFEEAMRKTLGITW